MIFIIACNLRSHSMGDVLNKRQDRLNSQLGPGGGSSCASRSLRKSSGCSDFTSPLPDPEAVSPDGTSPDTAEVEVELALATLFELFPAWAMNTSFKNFISWPSAEILSSSSLLSLFKASTFSFVSFAFCRAFSRLRFIASLFLALLARYSGSSLLKLLFSLGIVVHVVSSQQSLNFFQCLSVSCRSESSNK